MKKIETQEQLYMEVLPALKSKCVEFNMLNYSYIKENDIWNYLKVNIWNKSDNLFLCDIIDDILKLSIIDIDLSLKEEFKNNNRDKIIDNIDFMK